MGNKIKLNKGIIILQVIVFGAIAIMMISALASWAAVSIKSGRISYNREQAFQSAEAGIDYYRWHLAHAPSDYKDGTNTAGPYVHSLKDKNGNTVGQFSLTITAPSNGSTLVKLKSVGASTFDSTVTRTISSQVSKPSIAEHAFAGNDPMRFGAGTEIFGSVYVNNGIHFDGLAHNLVSSGVNTYTDSDSGSCTSINSYGVHTCISPGDPASPAALPIRSDVFEAGRKIGQPTIDFSGFVADIKNLRTLAQASGGFYRDVAGAGFVGYHLVLKTNDTFDLYKINSWVPMGNCVSSNTSYSWSINTQTLQGNYSFPSNGIIFLQDNTVIDGQIDGARLTIVAAYLDSLGAEPSDPSLLKNMIINNDLSYTNTDGTDSLGIVGQNAVRVGMVSDDNLHIDGALMAQHDAVGRFKYNDTTGPPVLTCAYKDRSTVTLYGMIASYGRYGFAYTDGTGYTTRNINYDANLLYAPPPSFPLTSSQYQILSWQEIGS